MLFGVVCLQIKGLRASDDGRRAAFEASASGKKQKSSAVLSLFLCTRGALTMDAPGKKEGQYSFLCLLA